MKGVKFSSTVILLCAFLLDLSVSSRMATRAQLETLEEQVRELTLKIQERQRRKEAAKSTPFRRATNEEILNENRKYLKLELDQLNS